MTQRLIYNLTGQVLRHVPGSRQTGASWVLEDLLHSAGDSGRTLDSGTATLDAASQALTAAAGPTQADATAVSIAATAAFVPRFDRHGDPVATFEIVDASGRGEHVVVVGVTTNTTLHLRDPLTRSYPATTSTIRGIELVTGAIASAVLQDENRMQGDYPMRVVWTYADGYRFQEQVRLVRDNAVDLSVDAIVRDIRELFPDVATRLAYAGRDTLPGFVRSMIRLLRADGLGRKIRLEEFLAGEQGHWAVVWRTMMHLASLGNMPAQDGGDPRNWITYCKGEFEARWLGQVVGEPGLETIELDGATASSGSSDAHEYREILTGL